MPIHNVDEAFDFSFWDTITVLRRTQQITQQGRVSISPQTSVDALAVVVPVAPDDLQRLPEYETMNKAIQIYTPFRLWGPAKIAATGEQTLPDQVVWHGSTFVVHSLDDYSGYGRGWVSAIAISVESVDAPPIPDPLGSA